MTHPRLCLSLKRGADNRDTWTGKGEGGREGERGSRWNSLQVSSFVSRRISADPPPPSSQNLGELPYLGRTKEQENATPCPERLLGKVPWWWAGLSKYVMARAQESRNQTLGMSRSHWLTAFCLWDARLMEWGCAFGTGSSNTSWETKTLED